MLISLEDFISRLKELDVPVYRDVAEATIPYPFIVYSFASRKRLFASAKEYLTVSEYRVSYFTKGTEEELRKFEHIFSGCAFLPFFGTSGNENDETVTNFTTFVQVNDDAK